jgi:hypothetical protein
MSVQQDYFIRYELTNHISSVSGCILVPMLLPIYPLPQRSKSQLDQNAPLVITEDVKKVSVNWYRLK